MRKQTQQTLAPVRSAGVSERTRRVARAEAIFILQLLACVLLAATAALVVFGD